MPIIKEKNFKVISVIENLNDSGLCDGESEKSNLCYSGFFKIEEDSFIISYREKSENGLTLSELTVQTDTVLLKKRGAVCCDIRFCEKQTHTSIYEVTPFRFDMAVLTKKIRNNLTKDGGCVDIHYEMNIGGQNKRVRLKIEV